MIIALEKELIAKMGRKHKGNVPRWLLVHGVDSSRGRYVCHVPSLAVTHMQPNPLNRRSGLRTLS